MRASIASASALPQTGAGKPTVTAAPRVSAGVRSITIWGPWNGRSLMRERDAGLPCGIDANAACTLDATSSPSTSPTTTSVRFSAM